ncbi:phosphoribosylformylglycinamidine synthase [Flavobacteriaceae bacterium]|nr:phosphoribosylformylglycinamidine synthase [Flavobacteriaceae bacterium]
MISFFGDNTRNKIFAVESNNTLTKEEVDKLTWVFGEKSIINCNEVNYTFLGPRAAMITPWSTNAVEICQNMGVNSLVRIEEFNKVDFDYSDFDYMVYERFEKLDQNIFSIEVEPEKILTIENIEKYNLQEGLSLNSEEIAYLNSISKKIGRKFTDSEVFGFSQVNSEHCRHKIFNGKFIIDGKEKESSLFKLIKETSKKNPNSIVSAYKDNVAFIQGPTINQFSPERSDIADYYKIKEVNSVISIKAETHNFPTTVEPFNGAATGSGGEIRDRLAGGKGSLPLAGTAVYMTPYPRNSNDKLWEENIQARKWLYQSPIDILIKASNGASDFGNKFGQPLITGSVLTFEHEEFNKTIGFDKVIMQAGGIGFGLSNQAIKDTPSEGDKIIVLGGDNYRIGMGGAAVSSADTGEFSKGIELNAVQRSNPEMQKRVANAIRGMVESNNNSIVSIHDHGAGGHLNCLSELVEEVGGEINLDMLPVGDPTLSDKEIIGNESQERMGLIIDSNDLNLLNKIAERERAPIYEVGTITYDKRFTIKSKSKGNTPLDLSLDNFFGSSPQTVMKDNKKIINYSSILYDNTKTKYYLKKVFKLEAVGCKDWLTNKVDRCVGGKVAKQQCVGPLQLPLNNCGVMALDFNSLKGVATSIGHSPISALIDPVAGSRNSITEALSNIIWAPLSKGLRGVSLSANWMWPCNNEGEDSRLYDAVESISKFAIELGINVPTGKDSLSMKQKYPTKEVLAPGTVIISAAAECNNISNVIEPLFKIGQGSIYYINLSQDKYKLGGSSFAQTLNKVGNETPSVASAEFIVKVFNTVQNLIANGLIVAGHDISAGGLITTLCEMCFSDNNVGADLVLDSLNEEDSIKLLFSENAGLVIQSKDDSIEDYFKKDNIEFFRIGKTSKSDNLTIKNFNENIDLKISEFRDEWFSTSVLLDKKQTSNNLAIERFNNFKNQPLKFVFPSKFNGTMPVNDSSINRPKAAIIREKGSNSEREMANAMYLAGFDVKDIHMTDLISGRENLEDIRFIGTVGGFSNSDVLGSAKGWAGAFRYNEKAKSSLENFMKRKDTLSVGICNGCQLFMELDLINPEHEIHGKMTFNDSKKHESAFTSVKIQKNNSIMLSSLEGSNLGVWISHGEGKFKLPQKEENYNIVAKYSYDNYPSNPNGSDYNTAMLCDITGRHLVTMPHIERSIFKWNWANYIENRNDQVSPWIEAFTNAKNWIINN